jgi:hypothetical protein
MAAKVGDVFEFDTPCGLAYFQVATHHPRYKTLIRVLPGLYESRPDIGNLVGGSDRFKAFYPVDSALHEGLIRSIGVFPVPDTDARFPLMKWPIGGEGHRYGWAIWDGRREVERRANLTEEQKDYPEPGIWNHALLLDNVASDWSWRDTSEPPPWRRPARPAGCNAPFSDELEDDAESGLTKHFLYFDGRAAAERAQQSVRQRMGITRAEVMPANASGQILLLVRHAPTIDPESLRRDFEEVAEKHGGNYDGWEASVD